MNAHEALTKAEQWKGRADDCGRISRAILALRDSLGAAQPETADGAAQGAGKMLNEDRDAVRWAREFDDVLAKEYNIRVDEGLLIAWFANAMMCGEDTYRWRQEAALLDSLGAAQPASGPFINADAVNMEDIMDMRPREIRFVPSETPQGERADGLTAQAIERTRLYFYAANCAALAAAPERTKGEG